MKYWRLIFLLTLILIAIALGFAWRWMHQPGVLPIKKVSVAGQRILVQETRIQKAILPYVAHGFFNIDVEGGQQALVKIPGIKSASIRRIWPDEVSITITEYQAFAKWQTDAWLSPEGRVFHTDTLPASDQPMPQFIALQEDIPLILTWYPQLSELLGTEQLHIKVMTRLGYNAWRLTTEKGFDIKLKLDDLAPLQAFLKIYPQLIEDNSQKVLNSVDLRYPTGFSVKWRNI